MCKVELNPEKNGIEIQFDEKPDREVLDQLSKNGFRWHNRKKIWYAKQTEERLAFTNSLSGIKNKPIKEGKTDCVIDLFNLTRKENIQKRDDSGLSCKEIASLIRKHLRTAFPMFKFSVTSDFDSINAYITSSPYEKDSDEVKAMLEYLGEYVESWKENSRYSFYGGRNYPCLSYDCKLREMTVSEMNIRELFQKKKQEWEVKEEERRAAEAEAYAIKMEEERVKYEELERIRKLNHEKIESSVEVRDVDYFIIDALEPGFSKEDWLSKYYDADAMEHSRRVKAKVSKEVEMDEETFKLFSKQLMDDYSFIAKTDGSETQDRRINSMQDYNMMSKEERETVEFYSVDCVAIVCNGVLKCIVDAQGFSYCRYVFLVDEQTKKEKDYQSQQVLDAAEQQELKFKADIIEDVSTDIISSHEWMETWNTDNQLDYMEAMINWIYANHFKLSKAVVQQIGNEDLKNMVYRIKAEIDSIQEQFRLAKLNKGQKITIIRISDFGGMSISHVIFDSVEYGKYAQYEKAVKMICKPKGKRSLYYNWYYRDVMIYDGWVDVPETILWDIDYSNPAFVTKKTKFLSCDRKQYDVIVDYLENQGSLPIINTDNPERRV